MITISPEAIALLQEKQTGFFIEQPQSISGCCIEVVECPSVCLGEPRVPGGFSKQIIQGVTAYVPHCFPQHGEFTVRVRNFFGFRRLALSGWRLA
jgi:hypothetical protein